MVDFKEIYETDDVELFEKSCNMTHNERLEFAEFIQWRLNRHKYETAYHSINRIDGQRWLLSDRQGPEKHNNMHGEQTELSNTFYFYVKLYKEITDINTCVGMQTLSEKLSTLADRLGFTEEAREMLIETTRVQTVLHNLDFAICGKMYAARIVGSSLEGTGKLNTETDTDILLFDPLIRIYTPSQNPETNMPYLRMVKDITTPAGYTKLQLFHNGLAVHKKRNVMKDYEAYFKFKLISDNEDGIFLSSEFTDAKLHNCVRREYVKNGPAITINRGKTGAGVDNVHAYICDALPDDVLPWFNRKRKYGWPSEETIKLLKQMGCFVVPVGHTNSPEQKLQWRLSFTNQEMYLMHNLNMTQYKCYVILKHLRTTFIKGFYSNSLCSYHLKTALFYRYLTYAVSKCLHALNEMVTKINCPNYFIPQENMFETKLDKEEIENLMYLFSILFYRQLYLRLLSHTNEDAVWYKKELILWCSDKILYHLEELFLELTHSFEMKYSSNRFEILDICKIIQCLTIFTGDSMSALCPILPGYTSLPELLIVVFFMRCAGTFVQDTILQKFLSGMPKFEIIYPILINSSSIRSAFGHVKRFLHSKIASYALVGCYQLTELERDMLIIFFNHHVQEAGTAKFINTRLKQASSLYLEGQHQLVGEILENVILIDSDILFIPFACCHATSFMCNKMRNQGTLLMKQLYNVLHVLEPNQLTIDFLTKIILTCLSFDSMEMSMVPVHLTYEALKAFGTPLHPRRFSWCKDFFLIVIDPIIFTYHLLYKNKEAMDDKPRMKLALYCLEKVMFDNFKEAKLWHFATALNCLGHIYMTKGWHRLAMNCFRKSMDEEWLYNAAKWHTMFLLFGKMQKPSIRIEHKEHRHIK